jgi:hypothetical protein
MNPERIEQARRFGGELCEIDGCTEYGTLEHVSAHLDRADAEHVIYTDANGVWHDHGPGGRWPCLEVPR